MSFIGSTHGFQELVNDSSSSQGFIWQTSGTLASAFSSREWPWKDESLELSGNLHKRPFRLLGCGFVQSFV